MSKASRNLILVIASLASAAAWAHPGHGDLSANTTLMHLLTEPDHILAILAVAGVAIAAIASSRGEHGDQRTDKKRRD